MNIRFYQVLLQLQRINIHKIIALVYEYSLCACHWLKFKFGSNRIGHIFFNGTNKKYYRKMYSNVFLDL
jgi:hypothetical protein